MEWYWLLLIGACIPIVGFCVAFTYNFFIVDDWWTPIFIIWGSIIIGVIYLVAGAWRVLSPHIHWT